MKKLIKEVNKQMNTCIDELMKKLINEEILKIDK